MPALPDFTTVPAISRLISRRVLAGFVGALPVAAVLDSEAKRKKRKKCKRGTSRCGKSCCIKGECTFKVKGNRWLLQSDCTISRTIQATSPKSLVIDGQGHTISMTGAKTSYLLSGLLVSSAEQGGNVDVVNLSFNGAGLAYACAGNGESPGDPAALYIGNTSGRVENVTFSDIPCTSALAVTLNNVTPAQSVQANNVRVKSGLPANRAGYGVSASGTGPARLRFNMTGSTFADSDVNFNSFVDGAVDGCTLTAAAISGLHGANVTVKNSKITNATLAIYAQEGGTILTATGNTITGTGSGEGFETTGIDFRAGSSGSASGNAISNYFDSSPSRACAIRVAPGVTPTIGTNTFPSPGNEFNVCYPI